MSFFVSSEDTLLEKPEFSLPKSTDSIRGFILQKRQERLSESSTPPSSSSSIPLDPLQDSINYFAWGAEELYDELSRYGLSNVWQLVSAYSMKTKTLGIEFALGPDVNVPFFELEFSVSLSASVSWKNYILITIQNLPATICPGYYLPDITTEKYNFYKIQFKKDILSQQLSIGRLLGKGFAFQLTVSLDAVFKASFPFIQPDTNELNRLLRSEDENNIEDAGDELTFGITATLGAQAQASLNLESVYLLDSYPSQYISASNTNFRYELEANIGVGKRNSELSKINTLINRLYEREKEKLNAAGTPVPQILNNITSKVSTTLGIFTSVSQISITDTLFIIKNALIYEKSKATIDSVRIGLLNNMELHAQLLISDIFNETYERTIEKIQLRLKELGYNLLTGQIKPDNIGEFTINGNIILIRVNNYSNFFQINCGKNFSITYGSIECDRFRLLPSTLYKAQFTRKTLGPGNIKTSLNYVSQSPAASASVEAAIPGIANLGASAKAAVKFARYRYYNSFRSNDSNIYSLVQDTQIRYGQVVLAAEFIPKSIINKLPKIGKSIGAVRENSIAVNSITYKSACVLYPSFPENSYNVGDISYINPLPGSGVNIGISVFFSTIEKISSAMSTAASTAQLSDNISNKIKKIAQLLKVKDDDVREFFRAFSSTPEYTSIKENCNNISNANSTRKFILESNFAVIGLPVELEIDPKTHNKVITKNLLNYFDNNFDYCLTSSQLGSTSASTPSVSRGGLPSSSSSAQGYHQRTTFLDSIHIRQRVTDLDQYENGNFKLGITSGTISASIVYNSQTQLGAEGAINIFRYKFRNLATSDPVANLLFNNNPDLEVPPTVLFFQ